MAIAGALTIAFSSILVRLSDTSPSTSAIFRCLYALPLLALLAWREARRLGARPARDRRLALAAGVFLGIDLLCWHRSIADIGAGLSTVLANLQVAAVPLLAWAVLGERPGRRVLAVLPIVLAGIVLISGALEQGAYGRAPAAGPLFGVLTGLTYACYMHGSGSRRPPAGPLFDVTLTAAATTLAGGLLVGDADLVPTWPGHAWLITLALTSQILGWLLISLSLPRLPAAVASMLLTIQPIGAVILAAIIFGEAPTALQVVGVVALLAALVAVAGSRSEPEPPPAAGPVGRSGGDRPGGDAADDRAGRDVARHDAARLHARVLPDHDAAQDRRARREHRARADHDGRRDELLEADRPLDVGDAVVEVDDDDLVVEDRVLADLDPLVGGDDAALAEPRARADARLAVHVEARAGADRAAVLERQHRAGGEGEADAAAEPDVTGRADAAVRAQPGERDAHHRLPSLERLRLQSLHRPPAQVRGEHDADPRGEAGTGAARVVDFDRLRRQPRRSERARGAVADLELADRRRMHGVGQQPRRARQVVEVDD